MDIHADVDRVNVGTRSGESSSSAPPGGMQHVDIAVLLNNLDRFSLLVQPIQTALKTIQESHGWAWRRPSVILGLNLACAICSSGSILSVLLLFTLSIAAVGISHHQTCLLKKMLPWSSETKSSNMSRQQLLQHYKLQLYKINNIVSQCNNKMEKCYSCVKWESPVFSTKCYSIITCTLICLFLLPANLNLMLFVNASLLLNTSQGFRGSISEIKETIKKSSSLCRKSKGAGEPDIMSTQNKASKLTDHHEGTTRDGGKHSGSDLNDVFHEAVDVSTDEESHTNNFHTEYDTGSKLSSSSEESDFEFDVSQAEIPIDDNGDIPRHTEHKASMPDRGSTKMAKVRQRPLQQSQGQPVQPQAMSAEVRQRLPQQPQVQPQAMSGFCTRCGTEFSTLSMKRHYCSHCGNHFCFRCCSYRAPKSVFGATAPGSDTETVPVCCECYSELTNITSTDS